MSEENKKEVVKKSSVKKTTPKNKSIPKVTKAESKKEIAMSDIPQDLIAQLTQQILSNLNLGQTVEEVKADTKIIENKQIKYTKAYLNNNKEIREEVIEVRSVFDGKTTFVSSSTKMAYKWLEKGAVEYLTVKEILSMESSSLRFLHTPWLVIEDIRIVEALGLKPLYATIKEIENLEEFLENDVDYIQDLIPKLPHDYRVNLISELSKKIRDKTIKIDYLVLMALEELLEYKFTE